MTELTNFCKDIFNYGNILIDEILIKPHDEGMMLEFVGIDRKEIFDIIYLDKTEIVRFYTDRLSFKRGFKC